MTPARLVTWFLWLALYAGTTALMYLISGLPEIRIAHAILAYIILIIAASRQAGRAIALTLTALSYVAVSYFYVPPRFTFVSTSNLDAIILLGFLITGWLLAELFARERAAIRVAEERTREVEQLSAERLLLEREAATARALQEAGRLRNALLGSLAHDLRAPVATLALLADPAAGFPGDVALRRVRDEAERLGEFIATLQRFANEGGGSALAVHRHEVAELVHIALRSSEALLTGREVRVAPAMPSLAVDCDLTLSVQALGNLLQNAARYAPADAPIDLFAQAGPSTIEIVVADRGPGVRDIDLEQLFAPMRRARPPQDDPDDGPHRRMGMGLAIARTFARAQLGDIAYRSRPGGGAEFVLRLPRSASAEVGAGKVGTADAAGDLGVASPLSADSRS